MELKTIFSGLEKFTTCDYEGLLSATFFTMGCNLRCRFCHNPEFINFNKDSFKLIQKEYIDNFLEKRKGLLDGIIICGGEPTIHKNLIKWISYIKSFGFKVKLDTNGTNPEMLKEILDKKLIDYIAIDFKSDPLNYKKTTSRDIYLYKQTLESINLVLNSYLGEKLNYDIRTTVHSELIGKEDIYRIADILKRIGVKKYSLQLFVKDKILDEKLGKDYTRTYTNDLKEYLEDSFEVFKIRNL